MTEKAKTYWSAWNGDGFGDAFGGGFGLGFGYPGGASSGAMLNRTRSLASAALLSALLAVGTPPSARAMDLHVSSNGNDRADGRSPRTAWRTLERVNRHIRTSALRPGDRILLESGARFHGSLLLADAGGGTPESPVVIASVGSRPARIEVPEGTGILVRETPWVTVSNLVLVGTGAGGGDGIRFDRLRPSTNRIAGVTIVDCRVEGFDWHGIMIDASQRELGYEQVLVRRVHARRNRHAGIQVYGGNQTGRRSRPHARVRIEDCLAEDNLGDPDLFEHHSGSGIFVDGVDGVRISGCVARGNGGQCRSQQGGPVGLWLHACRDGVVEANESHGNGSLLRDGGGFDLDAGCEDCVLRRNFSHDNRGPGFLVYTYTGAAYSDRGCRVTGNVSIRDGAPGTGYGGIQLGSEEGRQIEDLEVAHNTVIAGPGSIATLRIQGHGVRSRITRNLFLPADHGAMTSLSGFDHQLEFDGNHGWRRDGRAVHVVDGSWVVSRLAQWRNSTGPEKRFRVLEESFGDPGLRWSLPKPARGSPAAVRWPRILMSRTLNVGAPAD